MDQATQRTAIGTAILVVSTLFIVALIGIPGTPLLLGSIAAVGFALGAVLVGTAVEGV